MQIDTKNAVDWGEHHIVDEAAYCLLSLVLVGAGDECLVQSLDALSVDLGHVGSQIDFGLGSGGQLGFDLVLACLEREELILQGSDRHPFGDGVHDLSVAPSDAHELGFQRGALGGLVLLQAVHLPDELGTELLEQLRLHQVLLQSVEDCLLQYLTTNPQPILTGALVARCGAAEMGLADLDVAAAAGTALRETRQQVARPPPVPGLGLGLLRTKHDLFLPSLDRVPEVRFDDAQVGNVLLDHCVRLVDLGPAFASVGVLQVAELIPDELADVDLVVENTRPSCVIAVYGRRSPSMAARAGNTVPVEPYSDGPG